MPPDPSENQRLAETIRTMGLNHCVITSVDRDDLIDGGASFWANVISTIRSLNPGTTIEALIPDFDGEHENLDKIINANPDLISHNVETVRRLTPKIRTRAKYDRSLGVIKYIAENGRTAKSGFMLGLGEVEPEILETIDDLYNAGCRILTIGQYLKPSADHMDAVEYITPDKFGMYRESALSKGFEIVESRPLVRSSFHAEKHVKA
jgi:lipoic acid synthetase